MYTFAVFMFSWCCFCIIMKCPSLSLALFLNVSFVWCWYVLAFLCLLLASVSFSTLFKKLVCYIFESKICLLKTAYSCIFFIQSDKLSLLIGVFTAFIFNVTINMVRFTVAILLFSNGLFFVCCWSYVFTFTAFFGGRGFSIIFSELFS